MDTETATGATPPSNSRQTPAQTNRRIGLLLAIAFLARLTLLAALDPQTQVQGGDGIWYLQQGWFIAHAALETPLRTVGPLYPLSLAVAWRLAPDAPFPDANGLVSPFVLTLIRLVQVALSVMVVWLAYRLTRRLTSDPRAGLLAAAALGLGPAFVMEPFGIMTETLFMFWLTLGIWLYVRSQERLSNRGAAQSGFIFALAALTRPVLLLFPVLLAPHLIIVFGCRAGIRRSAVLLGTFALTLVPWNLYLLSTTGSPLPSGFSSNLWIGATGSGEWEGHERLDRRRQRFKGGDDDYLLEALGPITRHPLQWLSRRGRHLAGAVRQPHGTVNLTGPSTKQLLSEWWRQDRSLSGLAAIRHSPWFWLKLPIYLFHYAALALALLGAAVVLGRWRRYYSVFAIVGYLFGVYGILMVTPRYLFPAEVFLWVLGAVGVHEWWERRRPGSADILPALGPQASRLRSQDAGAPLGGMRRLRVCFVAERGRGTDGWGRYTVEVVRALREQGVTPVLVTADSETDRELAGIELHPILPPLFGQRGQTLRTLWRTRRLFLILEQCDVVHCLVEPYAPLVALSSLRSVPFLQTAHGTWAIAPLANPWQRLFFRPAFRRADTIVFQTKFVRDRMAKRMRLPRHLVATGGVRPELFRGPPSLNAPDWTAKGRVVLSVGAVKERKGHEVTLEAVALARKLLPDLHFVLIGAADGPGSCARDLQQKAVALGMTNAFHMLGHVPFRELVGWYQRADVFALLPVDRNKGLEGLGLVYLESAAAGVPAIGVRESGASEAIVDGETGLLVDQGNPQAAADAILHLLTDEALRARMGETARIRAHQLSWVNLASRLKETYVALISEARQKSAK